MHSIMKSTTLILQFERNDRKEYIYVSIEDEFNHTASYVYEWKNLHEFKFEDRKRRGKQLFC